MAIELNNPNTPTASNNNDTRQRAEYYINIGQTLIVSKDEDGNPVEGFVSLPYGLAIDTMQPKKSNSPIDRQSNALLDLLQKRIAEANIPHGENEVIHLELRVQRRHSEESRPVSEQEKNIREQMEIKFG